MRIEPKIKEHLQKLAHKQNNSLSGLIMASLVNDYPEIRKMVKRRSNDWWSE